MLKEECKNKSIWVEPLRGRKRNKIFTQLDLGKRQEVLGEREEEKVFGTATLGDIENEIHGGGSGWLFILNVFILWGLLFPWQRHPAGLQGKSETAQHHGDFSWAHVVHLIWFRFNTPQHQKQSCPEILFWNPPNGRPRILPKQARVLWITLFASPHPFLPALLEATWYERSDTTNNIL